jgi:hypothetical protein
MNFDIDLELLTRPATGTAVSLIAEHLRTQIRDERTEDTHDGRVRRDDPHHPVLTLAPIGAPGWATDTARVWNELEWTERHGPQPLGFEVRTRIPEGIPDAAMQGFAWALAAFVSRDLNVPVSYGVLDGTGPWSGRHDTGHHVRLCFPVRALAEPDGSNAILDRSGQRSGFAGRLAMASNPQLANGFMGRVAREAARIRSLPKLPVQPAPALSSPKRAPFVFEFEEDVGLPVQVPDTDPKVHPLVARLRREAPRGMTLPDLRDFEHAMSLSTHIEDALKVVGEHQTTHDGLGAQQTRTVAAILDHEYLLDRAREARSEAEEGLRDLQQRGGRLLARIRLGLGLGEVSRKRKSQEVRRLDSNVQALKAAVLSLRAQGKEMVEDRTVTTLALTGAREELKDCVRRLHGTDPQVLAHLVSIISGPERTWLKDAMAKAVPQMEERVEQAREDGKSGPPVKPSRSGMGPGR